MVYRRSPAASPQGAVGFRFGARVAPVEVPAIRVAAPWQSGCRRAMAAAACVGVAATTAAQ
ncbi:hypothetical protein BHM03_00053205 [Ensete ventricosum]|nr:hypothetical protein BHM03_00053205 [Ensete ventricosum]